jgi:hypothetical protein
VLKERARASLREQEAPQEPQKLLLYIVRSSWLYLPVSDKDVEVEDVNNAVMINVFGKVRAGLAPLSHECIEVDDINMSVSVKVALKSLLESES